MHELVIVYAPTTSMPESIYVAEEITEVSHGRHTTIHSEYIDRRDLRDRDIRTNNMPILRDTLLRRDNCEALNP